MAHSSVIQGGKFRLTDLLSHCVQAAVHSKFLEEIDAYSNGIYFFLFYKIQKTSSIEM